MNRLLRGVSLLLLALAPTLFLWKLTLAGRILVGLDPFNFFYPYHDGIAAAVASGRLPEWNPALFGGVPFLADSQAQLFYPPGWLFRGLSAPDALTWGIALHLAWAALGCYAWARHGLGMGRWAGWLAGALFALGGYLGAQVEHVNQVQAAAWLPWLLLGYEWGRGSPPAEVPATPGEAAADREPGDEIPMDRRREGRGVALGALALAMSFLAGHTQTTFISLVLVALWSLRWAARDDERTRSAVLTVQRFGISTPIVRAAWQNFIRVNFVPLAIIVLLGALIAAVQLVPTQSLSGLSTRSEGLTFREAASFSLDPRVWPRALLPTYGQDDRILSEYVGWVGFVGLALAALALRSTNRAARDFGLLSAGAGLFLATGGYNPFFWLLWRLVPGFDLFRAPARWLLLWALGAAILAGAGLEVLQRAGWRREQLSVGALRETLRGRLARGVMLAAISGLALFLVLGDWPPLGILPWWVGGLLAAAMALLSRPFWPERFPIPHSAFVLALLLAELWAASWSLDYQKATAPEAYTGLRPAPAHLIAAQPEIGAPRLLSLSDLTWDPGDLASLQERHADLLGEEAIYDLVVSTKLKEVLAPNQPMRWGLQSADGYGGGLLPSARWVEFQRTLPLARVVPDGRLREQLTALPRPALLDVMGVEWLVADKVLDWWAENVFHDLGAPVELAAGQTLNWEPSLSEVTALSLVVIGEWPEEAGEVRVGSQLYPLSAAEERSTRETRRGVERHLWLPITPPAGADELALSAAAPWTLGALSLVDERLPAFEPLPADPALRATFSGDVKVYRRVGAPGRAWVVPTAERVETTAAAADFVAESTFDSRSTVIVETGEELPGSGGEGQVEWLRDDPGAMELRVASPDGGWLVVADAPFPGWQATVNGSDAEWYPANAINRALFLPAGEHLVVWRYETPGLKVGLAATALGLALWLAQLLWTRRAAE